MSKADPRTPSRRERGDALDRNGSRKRWFHSPVACSFLNTERTVQQEISSHSRRVGCDGREKRLERRVIACFSFCKVTCFLFSCIILAVFCRLCQSSIVIHAPQRTLVYEKVID